MVDFGNGEALLTIGGGLLKGPRYSYRYMENEFFDEVYKHIFIGFRIKHFMM
ncbi:hypothetical protein JW879_09475 [candidate division WOR-3 bacterium]|nr:hypothetical protein [candidate division WOR-3 bacterium]